LTERAKVTRLLLQIERALLARAQLRLLVAAADTTVAGHREALRTLKARIARRTLRPGQST